MSRSSSLSTFSANAKRVAAQMIAFCALAGAVAPIASADEHSAQERRIASQAGGVSPAAAQAAVSAADRVEREMRKEGALRSRVLGCWREGAAISCTGEVNGNDGWVKWRCVVQIKVQKRGSGHKSKVTDAVCVAEEATKAAKRRDR